MYTYMNDFAQFYSPFGTSGLIPAILPILIVVVAWIIVLKGYALWHAARNEQKWWFIALLVVNTIGILEIVYLVWFRPSSSHFHRSHKSVTPAHESSPQA